MKINEYIERSHKRGLKSAEVVGDFLSWVDNLVLEGLTSGLDTNKQLTTVAIERIFRAS